MKVYWRKLISSWRFYGVEFKDKYFFGLRVKYNVDEELDKLVKSGIKTIKKNNKKLEKYRSIGVNTSNLKER